MRDREGKDEVRLKVESRANMGVAFSRLPNSVETRKTGQLQSALILGKHAICNSWTTMNDKLRRPINFVGGQEVPTEHHKPTLLHINHLCPRCSN